MAIGRTQELPADAARPGSGRHRFRPESQPDDPEALTKIRCELKDAGDRIWYITMPSAHILRRWRFNLTNIDRWFPVQIEELVRVWKRKWRSALTASTPTSCVSLA